jgi:8-oxo-dGTP diphosphatase
MKQIDVALAIIHRKGRVFLQRRDPLGSVLPGLWEFPGGKIEGVESPEAALRRELEEEIQWIPFTLASLKVIEHLYPERSVRLHPFLCEGEAIIHTDLAWGWFEPLEAARLKVPDANRALVLSLATLIA